MYYGTETAEPTPGLPVGADGAVGLSGAVEVLPEVLPEEAILALLQEFLEEYVTGEGDTSSTLTGIQESLVRVEGSLSGVQDALSESNVVSHQLNGLLLFVAMVLLYRMVKGGVKGVFRND